MMEVIRLYPVYSVGGITLSEVPGKTSLVIEFGNCQQRCKGCHSQHLWHKDKEISLEDVLELVYETMKDDVSCILLMGGTTNGIPMEDLQLLVEKLYTAWGIPIAIYSGLPEEDTPMSEMLTWFGLVYLKTGDYREDLGGLESPKSNQKFYHKDLRHSIKNEVVKLEYFWTDETHKFRQKRG